MNLRNKLRLSCKVFVCELGGFGISRVSRMLLYTLPELFKLSQVNTSLSHFKRHFRHMCYMAANVYKPFHHSKIEFKGVFYRLAA